VALNVGGIANLTAIPAGGDLSGVVSFDTGPGNCMIDTAAWRLTRGKRSCDRDGKMALRGTADTAEVKHILRHPYFRREPPKSTGWEEFGQDHTARLIWRMQRRRMGDEDIMRTLTDAVSESIAASLERFVIPLMRIDDLVVTGGGSRNPLIMENLKRRLPDVTVDRGEAFGLASDVKEACAFAYLAYLNLKGKPANLASQNAGLPPAILGTVYPRPM
jgi:anhydro-N-acetylmuramic acid kinase